MKSEMAKIWETWYEGLDPIDKEIVDYVEGEGYSYQRKRRLSEAAQDRGGVLEWDEFGNPTELAHVPRPPAEYSQEYEALLSHKAARDKAARDKHQARLLADRNAAEAWAAENLQGLVRVYNWPRNQAQNLIPHWESDYWKNPNMVRAFPHCELKYEKIPLGWAETILGNVTVLWVAPETAATWWIPMWESTENQAETAWRVLSHWLDKLKGYDQEYHQWLFSHIGGLEEVLKLAREFVPHEAHQYHWGRVSKAFGLPMRGKEGRLGYGHPNIHSRYKYLPSDPAGKKKTLRKEGWVYAADATEETFWSPEEIAAHQAEQQQR